MTDEEAQNWGESMSDVERQVLGLCSIGKSWGYAEIAKRLGVSSGAVRDVGARLRAMGLADVKPVRSGRQYDGSAIFLNNRGEQVRLAVEAGNVTRKP